MLELWETAPEDSGKWTVEALAAHLLSDLCGITLAGWCYLPNRGVCPHGNAYATDGGECVPCVARANGISLKSR